MNSFDFWDTLATRRVAAPRQVFELVERLLPWPGFAALRVKAELAARRKHAPREVTLADIYAALPELAAHPQRDAARDEELRLEHALVAPIPGNLRRLQKGDIVVSDFYVGADHLRGMLAGFGVKPLPAVHVSCDEGCAKHDGRLWDRLVERGLKPRYHVGDGQGPDVEQPRRRGIEVYAYDGAQLSRWERVWAEQAGGSLAGGAVAGCARAARLAHARAGEPPAEAALCDIFGAAVAPALVAFVDHVLDTCRERGIGRALFLARDGQLLHRLAQRRAKARGIAGIELVYAHASRAALHMPGFSGIEAAIEPDGGWLLEPTPGLSLDDLAQRTTLPLAELIAFARRAGIAAEAGVALAEGERARLPALFREPAVVARLAERSQQLLGPALAYYAGLGLTGEAPVALVDVGWSGRMQASLRRLLRKSGGEGAPLHGLYFCLARKQRVSERCRLDGFAFDPERDEPRGSRRNAFDGQRAMLEVMLEADEGSTLGFEQRGKKPQSPALPRLGPAPTGAALQAVRLQQGAVLAFAHEWGLFEAATRRTVAIPRGAALAVLEQLLYKPAKQDAEAFAGRSHEVGAGHAAQPLVARIAPGAGLARREQWGLWPEGSLAAMGGAPLAPLMQLVRRLRRG